MDTLGQVMLLSLKSQLVSTVAAKLQAINTKEQNGDKLTEEEKMLSLYSSIAVLGGTFKL